MKRILPLMLLFVLASCVQDDSPAIIFDDSQTLLEDLDGRTFVNHSVIACAGNDRFDTDILNVYFFPEQGASNFKFYETSIPNVDPDDFSNYVQLDVDDIAFLDGTLRVFNRRFSIEQWVIVTYEVEDRILISTPIRTKNVFQPTLWTDEVMIDQTETGKPVFDWEPESYENNAIFFEVVTTESNEVLSGTYTNDSHFQFTNLDNVVLAITESIPESLTPGLEYNIIVMDVSLDNWVNTIIKRSFIAE